MKKLTKEQRKKMAYEEYEKIRNQSYEEYKKIKITALEEYLKIKNPALEEYLKIETPAYEEYRKKIKEIEGEPEDIPEIIEQNGRKYRLVEEWTQKKQYPIIKKNVNINGKS